MNKETKTSYGIAAVLVGSLMAYKGYKAGNPSKAETEATRGGSFNVMAVLGGALTIGGLYLIFKKD
jgi:hypothetical protein